MGRQTLLVTQGIELRQKRTSPPKVLSDGDRSNISLCPRRGRPTRHHAVLTHDQFNTLRPQPTIVGWGLSIDVSRAGANCKGIRV